MEALLSAYSRGHHSPRQAESESTSAKDKDNDEFWPKSKQGRHELTSSRVDANHLPRSSESIPPRLAKEMLSYDYASIETSLKGSSLAKTPSVSSINKQLPPGFGMGNGSSSSSSNSSSSNFVGSVGSVDCGCAGFDEPAFPFEELIQYAHLPESGLMPGKVRAFCFLNKLAPNSSTESLFELIPGLGKMKQYVESSTGLRMVDLMPTSIDYVKKPMLLLEDIPRPIKSSDDESTSPQDLFSGEVTRTTTKRVSR